MRLTQREIWMMVHLGLSALLIHAFAEGMLRLRRGERLRRLAAATGAMAIVAWLTVLSGTWVIYPWYRAKPAAQANLAEFPRAYLLADPHLAQWHAFGMEWKEHVAWFSPMLATTVAWIVLRHGPQLAQEARLRRLVRVLFAVAFSATVVAGALGAFINKVAPNTFLDN
jgi:hypothetical protein